MSKPITTLLRGECRFAITPHSARSHLFCAEPVEAEGAVYCACHAALCYDRRPAEKRRADAERMMLAREFRRQTLGHRNTVVSRLHPPVESIANVEVQA